MSFTSSYVMAGIGTFFILFWLFLYIKYRNAYDQVIDAIDKKKFMFGEIYFIGFGFITLFHINIKTERGSKKIKEISEIYGRKYAEFYHYVITGGSISYFLTLLPMGFCLGAIANNVMLGVLGVVASALLLEYMSGEIKKNVNERREDILEDLPQMLSKFTLLINAGLIVRDAWFNEMMISAYLKGMSKLNAFKDNESGEVNMVAIVLIIIVVIALVAVFKDGISDVLSAAFKKIKEAIETL